jgi:hypothetical protein
MADPGVYELLRAMRMLVLDIAAEADATAASASAAARDMVYNAETQKYEFYKDGVLVYAIPP